MKAKTRKKPARSAMGRFFLRGIVTLAPVILTMVVFGLLYQMVDRYVTGPINSTIYWALEKNTLGWKALRNLGIEPYDRAYFDSKNLDDDLEALAHGNVGRYSSAEFIEGLRKHRASKETFFVDFDELAIDGEKLRDGVSAVVHPVIGVLASLLLVLWLGWIVGGFVGRRLVARLDQAMHLIPVVRSVYPYSKQLVEFFFAENKLEFDTVVAVRYPSPHLWSIAFVTSSALKTLRRETGQRLVSVFIPSSPMPMTGYTIFVEPKDLIALPMSIDEALRVTMTGGVLIPPHEREREDSLEDLAIGGSAEEEA